MARVSKKPNKKSTKAKSDEDEDPIAAALEKIEASVEKIVDAGIKKILGTLKGSKPVDEDEEDEEEDEDDGEDADDEDEDSDDDDSDGSDDDDEDEDDGDGEDDEDGEEDDDGDDDEDGEDDEDDEDGEEESDDEDDESEDEEEDADEDDDDEEGGSDAFDTMANELDSIPDSVFKQATKDSSGTALKEMKSELTGYFVRRGMTKAEAKETVEALKGADLKATFSEYYARFIDAEGEVHDVDEPYQATRVVKGKEKTVWCCNGVPMVNGKCAVNPKIKQPAEKGSKKAPVKKTKKTVAKKAPAKKTVKKTTKKTRR